MSYSSNPWLPDEDAESIYSEKTWLQGSLLSNIAYGVELTLFVMCFWILAWQTNRSNFKQQLFLLLFISIIFILGTIFMGAQAKVTQQAFIEYRNFPGGPGAYEFVILSNPVYEITSVCFVVANWLMDAFLVWRFVVIYKDIGRFWLSILTLLVPCAMLCTSFALGITWLIQISASTPILFLDIIFLYYVMTSALNTIVPILIVGRLLVYRHRIAKMLGPSHVTCYTNIVAILIESASIYLVFAILFLVLLGVEQDMGNMFAETVSQVQTVSSLLIIFRVATGKAWTKNTTTQIMTN
ncbi:hypothetical protein IEO21_04731 [Rhodonia placenta]|uniref:Uncharacterized protein n=1 Tax=Rhodonia placenta TaxID=104341 RepID=A0A8H7U2R7_9APHY|nr:hypothetical protein IEO21_04731 [Postia placenta]